MINLTGLEETYEDSFNSYFRTEDFKRIKKKKKKKKKEKKIKKN